MKDRVLFRGKRIDGGGWTTGLLCDFSHEMGGNKLIAATIKCRPGDSREVDPETIGQCTGLRDKNGVLIFEGDILLLKMFDILEDKHIEYHLLVEYSLRDGCWLGVYKGRTAKTHLGQGLVRDLELIGNVTDNPELLKAGDAE